MAISRVYSWGSRRSLLSRRILVLALAALTTPYFVRASTIQLSDTFADGDRTNQALPNAAAWYASKVAADVTVVGQQLQVNTVNGNSGVLAYFEPAGFPATLGIGSSLQLSFDFSLTGPLAPQDRAFAFYLYNSGNSRLSADDNSGFNSPLFSGYSGYGITYDPDSINGARYRTVERNVVNNNLFTSTANVPLGSAQASAILTAGTTYTASLTLTRGASSITVSGNINGSLIGNVDLSSSFTQFDTLAIFGATGDIPAMTLDNVLVTLSATPEPSAYSLFALGGIMLLLMCAKRNRGPQHP